jgi:hypothetical protein
MIIIAPENLVRIQVSIAQEVLAVSRVNRIGVGKKGVSDYFLKKPFLKITFLSLLL